MLERLDPRFADALQRLPDYLGSHVLVSFTALALGVAISLPLAMRARHRPGLRGPLLAIASIAQTIPGLALLALFYPLLVGLAALSQRYLGVSFSALGFLPSVLALTLYTMLPVLRNTITGLNGVDADVHQAAVGVGMTPKQALWMVEIPLAVPVIMAGIRTAAVWVIGTATLSTPIGQTSLGNYIFTGLQTQNWVFVLVGCVAAAVLALVVDQMLALMESGARRRKRWRIIVGLLGLAVVVAGALTPVWLRAATAAAYVIGSKPFGEQYILAALIEQRLRDAGLPATRREGLGSSVVFNALVAGEIDVYVDYSGTLWANQLKRTDVKPPAEVLAQVTKELEAQHAIKVVGSLGFENAYALAMPRKRAEELNARSIGDLAPHAPQMSIAGDYEFFGRPEWMALRDTYGLNFRAQRQMQPEFMYPAIAAADVDVISAYTSDGRIAQYELSVLDDPQQAIPPYEAILLISPRRANDRAFIDALQPLIGAIDVAVMRDANLRSASGTADAAPVVVARWLWNEAQRRKPAPR